MPFRCSSCNKLSRIKDGNCTETPLKCDFERIELIHYVSPEGKGKKMSSGSVVGTGDGSEKPSTTPLYLGCDAVNDNLKSTPCYDAVTCLDCISNHPPIESVEE